MGPLPSMAILPCSQFVPITCLRSTLLKWMPNLSDNTLKWSRSANEVIVLHKDKHAAAFYPFGDLLASSAVA